MVCVYPTISIATQYHRADVDECADTSLNTCASNAMCVNSPGSFACSCPPGFVGDPTVDCQGENGKINSFISCRQHE